MNFHLANALAKHYRRENNKIIFRNNSTLNQVALQMWELLDYCEIDNSVLSKVINGQRLFTFKQLRVLCKILKLSRKESNLLFDALIEDKLKDLNLQTKQDKYKHIAKINRSAILKANKFNNSVRKLNKNSRNILKKLYNQLIPKNNHKSKINIQFSNNAYYYFVNKGVQKYNHNVEKGFSQFNVSIPYCDFELTETGLENNCKCGYHLATYGIIKEYLLKKRFTKQQIQDELNQWIFYFFPKETIQNYLINNPNIANNNLLSQLKNS
jgi:hypothetical protein